MLRGGGLVFAKTLAEAYADFRHNTTRCGGYACTRYWRPSYRDNRHGGSGGVHLGCAPQACGRAAGPAMVGAFYSLF
jgi:hypothetical protein